MVLTPQRHRYDVDKAHQALLAIVAKRVSLRLGDRLPSIPPYSDSSLFYILPLPRHTDRLGRPIVVLSLRQVLRDENGKMDDMKTWSWWALEMVRRTLHDYWAGGTWREKGQKRARGYGGEGCVMLVDAAGSSYRNLVSHTVRDLVLNRRLRHDRRSSFYQHYSQSGIITFQACSTRF